MTAKELIAALGLEPLPGEGGMSAQTYLSRYEIDGKAAGTAIDVYKRQPTRSTSSSARSGASSSTSGARR